LALNPGELGQLNRYALACIWIYEAFQANVQSSKPPISRPAGLDQPNPRAVWDYDLSAAGLEPKPRDAWDDDLRPQRIDDQPAGGGAESRSQRLDDPTDKDWRPRRIDDPF
jgi:hypothetical protein